MTFKLCQLDKNNNYNRIKEAIRGMSQKWVEYEMTTIENKTEVVTEVITVLISGLEHKRGTEYVTIAIPRNTIFYLSYIGQGYTEIQQTVAMSLPSRHSKRLYEIMSKWVDKGCKEFYVDDLREKLGLKEGQYKRINDFFKGVIEPAERHIKESRADYYFMYKKLKTGRRYDRIMFLIHKKNPTEIIETPKIQRDETTAFANVYRVLNYFIPNTESSYTMDTCTRVQLAGNIKKMSDRLDRLMEKYNKGEKTKGDFMSCKNLIKSTIVPEMLQTKMEF